MGKEVIPFIYDDVHAFSEGLAAVCRNGNWGFIDQTGKEVIPFVYDHVSEFSEGFVAVYRDQKWEMIDKFGETVIRNDRKYDSIGNCINGLIRVDKGENVGYINQYGDVILECVYQQIDFDREVFIIYHKMSGWKLWNITKDFSTSLNYEIVHSFHDGLAAVCKKEKWGFIDRTGKEVIPCEYDSVFEWECLFYRM